MKNRQSLTQKHKYFKLNSYEFDLSHSTAADNIIYK